MKSRREKSRKKALENENVAEEDVAALPRTTKMMQTGSTVIMVSYRCQQ